jgi:O-antigen/teichoic acid export membrane protein
MVYFARELGSSVLGTYSLVLMMVSWLSLLATLGVGGALQKRISEGTEESKYLGAGTALTGGLFIILSLVLLALRDPVNEYIGASVAILIIPLLFVTVLDAIANAVLHGQRLVHISSILTSIKTVSQSLIQAATVFVGIGLVGLLGGYFAGLLVSAILAITVLSLNMRWPERKHFASLIDYAKYSWFSQIQGSIYNWTDLAVLGFFVTQSLIGVYSVAWNLASFIAIFSTSITASLFPELSEISANKSKQSVSPLVTQSLTYAGLFGIPGFVGSLVVGERIMRIYGPEFTRGTLVLQLLIAAIVLYSYQNQFLNTLNGIDRPDLALWVNTGYVLSNIVLNVVLVSLYGWTGAAVATMLSAFIGLVVGYWSLSTTISFAVPYGELARQVFAAGVMGVLVQGMLVLNKSISPITDNLVILIVAVGSGATVYMLVLFAVSSQFRETLSDNLPANRYTAWFSGR